MPPSRSLITLVGLFALGAGCGTGPDEGDTVYYQLTMTAFASDTTPALIRSYECFVYGSFNVPRPVPASGTAQVSFLTLSRRLNESSGTHHETTFADSIISDATVQFTGLGGDSLTFTLGAGGYVTTLGPGGFSPTYGQYEGPWICDAEFPLAQDSTLDAYGYDSNLAIQGTWRISEAYPID